MLVVQLWEEANAPPPSLFGVSGLGAADPQAVEEDWEGLPLGASQGAAGELAVEGGGYRGSVRVSGGYAGWVQAKANVDERESVGQVSEGDPP